MKKIFHLSIRCYFAGEGNYTQHYQDMPLKDIPRWVEAYQFTHPTCEAINIRIVLKEGEA